tara:strand:+ start:1123 stop:1848 length:726 start_codon:yes stop_codon:yes gene_type:complete
MYILRMNALKLVVVVVCAGSFGPSAFAGVMQLDSDDRGITLKMGVSWIANDRIRHEDDLLSSAPRDAYENWNSQRILLLAKAASLNATQDSYFSGTEFTASGFMGGVAIGKPDVEYLSFEAIGFSRAVFGFSLSEETSMAVDALLSSGGPPCVSSLRLRGVGDTQFDFQAMASGQFEQVVVNEELVLGAGSYLFEMVASLDQDQINFGSNSSFSGSLRVVPAPSTLGLLGVSGLIASRRRR